MADTKEKRRWGDRKDGKLIRDIDPMHYVMGYIQPQRIENEAFISEQIDLTKADEYLAKRNAEHPEYKYNVFQLIVASMLKTIILRPKLNRFIANSKYYQRNEISAAFVVKREFSDKGEEVLAYIRVKEDDTLDTIHNEIYRLVSKFRGVDYVDPSSEAMDIFNKMPRWLSRILLKFMVFLDKRGKVPQSLIETDPHYATLFLSNVGSIKLRSGYHHLTNWGTSSLFCLMGEIRKTPVYEEDGSVKLVNMVDLGLTIDERIADGYYYSKSIRLAKHLIEHPELLERPFSEPVEFEK